jgi:hypothetical protein
MVYWVFSFQCLSLAVPRNGLEWTRFDLLTRLGFKIDIDSIADAVSRNRELVYVVIVNSIRLCRMAAIREVPFESSQSQA